MHILYLTDKTFELVCIASVLKFLFFNNLWLFYVKISILAANVNYWYLISINLIKNTRFNALSRLHYIGTVWGINFVKVLLTKCKK
jgi:hypothetical protein